MKPPRIPVLKRSSVPTLSSPDAYKQYLRRDFWFSCGYCTLAESELSGINFEVEHYYPQEHFPTLRTDYANLYYSCCKCNDFKTDYFPGAKALENGDYIIRADQESLLEHMEVVGDSLSHTSRTGYFHIEKLFLNRKQLKLLRRKREEIYKLKIIVNQGLRALSVRGLEHRLTNKNDRVEFFRLRRKLKQEANRLKSHIVEVLQGKLRSPAIDPEPRNSPEAKSRRQFLKSMKVLYPGGKPH